MVEMIIALLAQFGWEKDAVVDVFGKTFETAAAPTKRASIWLGFYSECNQWWLTNGDFTSAGENVLATCHAIFPVGIPKEEVEKKVSALVAQMEHNIAGAYSVRLLRTLGPRSPNTMPSEQCSV